MRVVSLLPSATELAFALGLDVVGVSHECDHPAAARGLPALTRARLGAAADTSAAIHRAVTERSMAGLSLYDVDLDRLRALAPDLVLTQDVCDVCAVSLADVQSALARAVGATTQLLALSPRTLEDTFSDAERVASAAGVPARGVALAARLRTAAAALAARTAERAAATLHLGPRSAERAAATLHLGPRRRPRVLALEWLDPPMVAGHWTPALLRLAGADPILGHDGGPTHSIPWDDVASADPDVLVLLPCGFTPAQTAAELPTVLARPAIASLAAVRAGRVLVLDGNAYWNRPGPRLVEGAAVLAARLAELPWKTSERS